jgi:hypothetical protein
MHTTYLQQWNVSIQRQISSSTAVDLAYVANKGTHVNQNWSINDPPPGQGAIQSRRPYPQWGGVTYPVFDENANYNYLQAKIETRSWRGLSRLVMGSDAEARQAKVPTKDEARRIAICRA